MLTDLAFIIFLFCCATVDSLQVRKFKRDKIEPLVLLDFLKAPLPEIDSKTFAEIDFPRGYKEKKEESTLKDEQKNISENWEKLLLPNYVLSFWKIADLDENQRVSFIESQAFAENDLKVAADKKWRKFFNNYAQTNDEELTFYEFARLLTAWFRGDTDLNFLGYHEESNKDITL